MSAQSFHVRCKAFKESGTRIYEVMVVGESVKVYHDPSERFTYLHDLSRAAVERIVRVARDHVGSQKPTE